MMRRILMLVVVALVMAAMMAASALPVLASSCIDNVVVSQHGPGNQGNDFGQAVSGQAKFLQPLGQTVVKPDAQADCGVPR